MIPQGKYRIIISDVTWNYAAPGDPGAYAAAALAPGVSTAQQELLVAQHKEEQTAYADYLRSQEVGKEGDDALAPLKKQYINFGNSTIHSMILHLQEKMVYHLNKCQALWLSVWFCML